MKNWKVSTNESDAPLGFPFAIVNGNREVIAWVKNKTDADFIKKADGRISRQGDETTRYKRLYMGRTMR